MTAKQLFEQIKQKKSFLCIGLDTDLNKLPSLIKNNANAVFDFNKAIIDETAKYAVAYKPNLAFYEVLGEKGWAALGDTVKYIRENYPEVFIIADAKRGDIGNTSDMYAQTFFSSFNFDAVTLSPYMGKDSATPFFKYTDKWVILLALTSNESAFDFQMIEDVNGQRLFEAVISKSKHWGNHNDTMYVVGATKAEMLTDIRKIIPEHFLLIPGVGAQGGSLADVARYGMNECCGLLVNSSRGIIYADSSENFAVTAGKKAFEMQQEMEILLTNKGLL